MRHQQEEEETMANSNHFLFDVDGTLTPSREEIDYDFRVFLVTFMQENKVSFVTGSDIKKTEEQLGRYLTRLSRFNFNCSGNSITQNNNIVYESDWCPSDELQQYLNKLLTTSNFAIKTGTHIEKRPGSINFSVVGRQANKQDRQRYVQYDNEHNERYNIQRLIESNFPDVSAVVGGETGIDLFEKNKDKRQVLQYISEEENVIFFGDMMQQGGNDRSLLDEIRETKRGISYNVVDWKHTFDILHWNYFV
jgi:phosphomannomutase